MSACAIIAEYNPFHNGHLYHIEKTKEQLGDIPLVCILSGSFTQRGEPAFANKWQRAKWALEGGFDLIIELPFIYSVQSANRFAAGAVNIIKGIKPITHISFGSEEADLEKLKAIAEYKNSPEYELNLNSALKDGNTFAKANEIALTYMSGDTDFIKSPNAILAAEYIAQLKDSSITPIVIKREDNYNQKSITGSISGATAIRQAFFCGDETYKNSVPNYVYEDIKGSTPQSLENYFQIILSRIFTLKQDGLKTIHEINEGLENRIYEAALKAKTMEELLMKIKTKRYLHSRLQRIMLYILLNITKDFMAEVDKNGLPVYARVLALNDKGASLLLKGNTAISVVSKAADYKSILSPLHAKIFEKDLLATNMYSIFSDIRPNEDFLHEIIKTPL